MLTQLLAAAVGVWLMFAPATLGLGEGTSNLFWILGPLVIAFGVMASSAILRGLRWVNVVLGALVIIGPWLVGGASTALLVGAVSGLAIMGLSLLGGHTDARFGGGWRSLFG
jgi:hypothetical protein